MFKKITIFLSTLLVLYISSFHFATEKYYILLKPNQCGVARLVSSEWQRRLFFIAHEIEKIFLNQRGENRTMHVEIKGNELKTYFSKQLCNISNGHEIGS